MMTDELRIAAAMTSLEMGMEAPEA